MSDPVPTTTPAAPTTAPATPAPAVPARDTMDAAMERVQRGEPAPSAAPAAAAAAAKRLLKLKLLDDKEEELDLDAAYADETRRTALVADIQKGRNYERAIERERRAAEAAAREATKKQYQDFITRNNLEFVQDPSSPDGWKLVGKQSTTPADPELDPLTTEEEALKPKLADGDVDAVLRAADIRAERKMILAQRKQREAAEAVARQTQAAESYERAKSEVVSETKKYIAARTKSFDGPDSARVTARLEREAVAAAEAAAREGKDWSAVLEAAKGVVFSEADAFDARAAHWRANLPGASAAPPSAPLVGATPSGGGGSPKYKNMDEALDAITPGWRKGR